MSDWQAEDSVGAKDGVVAEDGLFEATPEESAIVDEPDVVSVAERALSSVPPGAPLAVRMRPLTLGEVVGQQHLLGPGAPLRRMVEGSGAASVLLYGPPGTGKTTLASLISGATGRRFEALSALSAGVKEVRGVIELARRRLLNGEQTVLFIDEVHRFSKTQQDALLAAVENRIVLLVGATTENPSFSVVSALLSRSLVLQLQSLTAADVQELLERAVADERGFGGAITIDDDAMEHLVRLAAGDARRALTALEAAAGAALDTAGDASGPVVLDLATVEASVDKAAVRYDRAGDQHYDVISAFIKSIRGSDVDAALHYLARMLTAGEDPRFIARRLVVHASEDIGMADPMALQTATAAAQAVQLIGMPEARLALAQATIHLATAPKSGAVIAALGAAMADVAAGNPDWYRRTCVTGTTRVPSNWATQSDTSTRTTHVMVFCGNSIHRTIWWVSTITSHRARQRAGDRRSGEQTSPNSSWLTPARFHRPTR